MKVTVNFSTQETDVSKEEVERLLLYILMDSLYEFARKRGAHLNEPAAETRLRKRSTVADLFKNSNITFSVEE